MAKVLIASSNPWSFCMAVEQEFAALHRDNQVDAIDLFKLASRYSPHWRRRDRAIEVLNRKYARFILPAVNGRDITGDVRVDGSAPPMPATFEALRSYEVEGAKVGLAVLSSVSSHTTIQVPRGLDEYGAALEPAWRSAHRSLRVGQAVWTLGYDTIVIFNGRHCYSRPFCDIVGQSSEIVRYEQGSSGNRYIAAAGSVHEPASLSRIVREQPFDREAGEAFYNERFAKDGRNEVRLITETQHEGLLPDGFRAGEAVTFFTSSSDEMFAISDQTGFGSFPTQHDIALSLADACSDAGLQAVVRLHPHLRFKHEAWRREWNFGELERRGVLVLQPEDSCDSYAVLNASRAVVTTGSTIGFEASYLGIPNAVVGTFLAGCLGASTVIDTAEELRAFIQAPDLPARAREGALLFGSFHKTGGKLLPALDVGRHPNMARLNGWIVDPVRYGVQKLRSFLSPVRGSDDLDIKSGMQRGRVLLPPGTDYSSAIKRK